MLRKLQILSFYFIPYYICIPLLYVAANITKKKRTMLRCPPFRIL
ncbi:hypothetical protein HMPREF9445_02844 [Bacteroides clarus YIT 12056]|uniref:Uncharacterized protein n=1 Tax=Bacteroides clarus YIT 12056 TaxID=762984 RepID=A0ABN0CJQ2_9BACE|nr:hypothetical protein HMPREF9445_02844 [Bacteroides clarus YIT 12056]